MSLDADRYLVTGGLGFLGSYLTKALVDAGKTVRVLDNAFRGSERKLGEYLDRVELIEGDIRDKAIVDRAVDGIEVVCHLAFINGTKYFYEIPEKVLSVGVKGTINMLEASLEAGVSDFIFASSSEVYQTPDHVPTDESELCKIPDTLNPRYSYAGAKLIGEILCFNYGQGHFRRTVVFRPHNVYGPDMGFEHVIPEFIVRLRRLMKANPGRPVEFPIQGDGSETRAFCHAEDFTDGLMLVIEHGEDRNIYHIGMQEEVAIRDLATTLAKKMGVEIQIRGTAAPAGGTPRRCPDISKLAEFGYAPRRPLSIGLDDSIEWYGNWADEHPE